MEPDHAGHRRTREFLQLAPHVDHERLVVERFKPAAEVVAVPQPDHVRGRGPPLRPRQHQQPVESGLLDAPAGHCRIELHRLEQPAAHRHRIGPAPVGDRRPQPDAFGIDAHDRTGHHVTASENRQRGIAGGVFGSDRRGRGEPGMRGERLFEDVAAGHIDQPPSQVDVSWVTSSSRHPQHHGGTDTAAHQVHDGGHVVALGGHEAPFGPGPDRQQPVARLEPSILGGGAVLAEHRDYEESPGVLIHHAPDATDLDLPVVGRLAAGPRHIFDRGIDHPLGIAGKRAGSDRPLRLPGDPGLPFAAIHHAALHADTVREQRAHTARQFAGHGTAAERRQRHQVASRQGEHVVDAGHPQPERVVVDRDQPARDGASGGEHGPHGDRGTGRAGVIASRIVSLPPGQENLLDIVELQPRRAGRRCEHQFAVRRVERRDVGRDRTAVLGDHTGRRSLVEHGLGSRPGPDP